MNSLDNIILKLNAFTKKYYTKALLKGTLLFLCFGLMVFLCVVSLEYFLWLNSTGRLLLFLLFIAITLYLIYQFLLIPLFYLFRLKRGISNKEAAVLIGKHFPGVGDKLYNLLDLADDKNKSELLLASIEQRSQGMDPIPFVKAINFKDTTKYIKYTIIPIIIIMVIWLTGNLNSLVTSYDRVVNFEMAYEKPAPFSFMVLNSDLSLLKGENITLKVQTTGVVKPENVFIVVDGKEMLLQETANYYEYTFVAPEKSMSFYFKANDVFSREYSLLVLDVPIVESFEMVLDYPKYLNKKEETIRSTGNAIFPEGTNVSWRLKGSHIDDVFLVLKDTFLLFDSEKDEFSLLKKIDDNLQYQISTANSNVKNYENLGYTFNVIKDANPTIAVEQVLDSLHPNVSYYIGNATDDYKLKSIRLVCYPADDPNSKEIVVLSAPDKNVAQFYYTFPSGLNLGTNTSYNFYFEAVDNDGVNGSKSARSQLFSTVVLNDNQLKNKELERTKDLLKDFDATKEKAKVQKDKLDAISRKQKESINLNYNEQSEVKDFIQKQQNQEQLMEKFSKELKDNLQKSDPDSKENRLLKERLERQELEAKKNQTLLEELKKIADKINKEELTKRLEDLAKSQKNSERNLEQLLELTKKYYVTEKLAQLAKDLDKMSKAQEVLSELKLDSKFLFKEQEKLNSDFKEVGEELDELEKDNARLQKPLDIDVDKLKQESIAKDQKDALSEINKHQEKEQTTEKETNSESDNNKAASKQQSAAKKMKQLSEALHQASSSGSSSESIAEDAEMLRQILENLIMFSFNQEELFDELEIRNSELKQFSGAVRRQKELRGLFEHVDDSLFSLSLRQPDLSEFVNEQITEVYYNIDKSIENIAESRIYQSGANQKYVLTAANSLADYLANMLDNLNQNMQSGQGQGQGKGKGFQLPDIIQSQSELQKKMGEKGEKPGGESGKNSGEGQKGENGEDGIAGKGGKEGISDEKNKEGNEGSGNSDGTGQPSEEELKEIYEIYKEQQTIRQQLEQQLEVMISNEDRELAKKLVQQMEDFEKDLLENGITDQTREKANTIQHQLLKLENASLKQGEKTEREANSNKNKFKNPITSKPEALKNYRNEIEILNRQALPLHQIFQSKVQRYFKVND